MTTTTGTGTGTWTPPRTEAALLSFLGASKRAGLPKSQVANFANGGYTPTPKQLQFHALARLADKDNGPTQIGQGGGRGGAKSHAAIAQVILDDLKRYPGLKFLFLRKIGRSAQESFEDLLAHAVPHLLPYYVPSNQSIDLPNGSRCIVGGFRANSDIDKYVGVEYDGVVIEEANLITYDKYLKLRGSVRSSKPGWRPRAYLGFNPGEVGHAWVKSVFVLPWRKRNKTNPLGLDAAFVFSTVDDNPFVEPSYIDYLNSLTGWLKRAWRFGDFDIAAGQFFTNWREDVHVIEPRQVYPGWHFWLSQDYGHAHWNVILLWVEVGEEAWVIDEYVDRFKLVPQLAHGLEAMLSRWGLDISHIDEKVAGADLWARRGTTSETLADQWEQEGVFWTPADMDRVQGAADLLKRLGDPDNNLPPKLFVFKNCHGLIEHLPLAQMNPNRPGDVLKQNADAQGLGGDDYYDSCRYGIRVVSGSTRVQKVENPMQGYRG
jgi:phage terminase large subunit